MPTDRVLWAESGDLLLRTIKFVLEKQLGRSKMDHIRKIQSHMPEGMQAAVFTDPANRFWLTGMHSSAGAVVITRNRARLLIDFRYYEAACSKVRNCEVVEERDRCAQILAFLQEEKIHSVSIHTGYVTMAEYQAFCGKLTGMEVDASGQLAQLTEELRAKEDEEEIACHRKAQEITDHTFSHILNYIRPGVTETDISHEIGYTLTRLGSDDKNFNFIVASGPNSSLPHGFAGNRMIQNGDFVTMDFGAVYHGYLADMTRTVAVGKISDEQKKVYETVYEAQERAFSIIRPGAVCCEVDRAARDYIYGKGYRGCFSHGLGHSAGVEVHENPRFNETCTDLLHSNTVITVEPGIYLAGRFGVRIEDMIVVREGGFEDLAHSPRELIVL